MTASNIISNETIKVAGIVTTSADGINVSAGVTARTLAIQNVTETDHFVGLNTVFIDHTGIAATTLTITDTAYYWIWFCNQCKHHYNKFKLSKR